jgi:6-phosphogluconate dehydrogenase
MKIGFIGLGKMGGSMTKRLVSHGHEVVAYDPNEEARSAAEKSGVHAVSSRGKLLDELKEELLWLMIPSQFVDEELDELLKEVGEGAIIIDGGNSDFRLSQKRAERCKKNGVIFIDVGTSGGILGLEQGYSMMIGGDEASIKRLSPIFDALAPKDGWAWFGDNGSGHYVKMVHNAIEYGLMEAYAEGYRLLKEGSYKDIDLAKAGEVWQHGSIIQSLLNELSASALLENPTLNGIGGFVHESGEARWALEVAKEHQIDMPAIESAFAVRIASQNGETHFATKLLAAMRNKFGGHAINKDS